MRVFVMCQYTHRYVKLTCIRGYAYTRGCVCGCPHVWVYRSKGHQCVHRYVSILKCRQQSTARPCVCALMYIYACPCVFIYVSTYVCMWVHMCTYSTYVYIRRNVFKCLHDWVYGSEGAFDGPQGLKSSGSCLLSKLTFSPLSPPFSLASSHFPGIQTLLLLLRAPEHAAPSRYFLFSFFPPDSFLSFVRLNFTPLEMHPWPP